MRWKIDDCPDADGGYTIREDDGTGHGDTETCIATVYGGESEQKLIESAPLLAEQVRILREALGEIAGTSASEAPGESLLEHLQAGEDAENSLADIQGIVHRALEATKETP